jgi:predicted GNAT family acetyltransferase
MTAAIMKTVSSDSAVHVSHDASQHRFEVRADDYVAFLAYERRDGRLVVTHTEVPSNLGGRGIGGQLVQAAVAFAKQEQLRVVPLCPFARTYLRRHPELAEG